MENSEENNYRVEFVIKWKDYMNPMKIFQAASIISKNLEEIQQQNSAFSKKLKKTQENNSSNPVEKSSKEDSNKKLKMRHKKNVEKTHWLRFSK